MPTPVPNHPENQGDRAFDPPAGQLMQEALALIGRGDFAAAAGKVIVCIGRLEGQSSPQRADLVEANLTLGGLQLRLGDLDAAEVSTKKALSLLPTPRGSDPDASFYSAWVQARTQLGVVYSYAGKFEWRSEFDAVLRSFRSLTETPLQLLALPVVSKSECIAGDTFVQVGEYDAAEEHYRNAITMLCDCDEPNPSFARRLMHSLGNVLRVQGKPFDPDAFERLKQRVTAAGVNSGGEEVHYEMVALCFEKALVLTQMGDFCGAVATLEPLRTSLSTPGKALLASSLARSGGVESALQMIEQPTFRKELTELQRENTPSVARTESLCGSVYLEAAALTQADLTRKERLDRAQELLTKAADKLVTFIARREPALSELIAEIRAGNELSAPRWKGPLQRINTYDTRHVIFALHDTLSSLCKLHQAQLEGGAAQSSAPHYPETAMIRREAAIASMGSLVSILSQVLDVRDRNATML